MARFCGWVFGVATSNQIEIGVDRLGGWDRLLLGFCGWWLVVGLWRW